MQHLCYYQFYKLNENKYRKLSLPQNNNAKYMHGGYKNKQWTACVGKSLLMPLLQT